MTASGIVAALIALSGTFAPASAGAEPAATATEPRQRTFNPTPGVVRAPILSHSVHGRSGSTHASASAVDLDLTGGRIALRRANPYRTQTGGDVWVAVSKRYAADSSADRNLVDFIESLLHGKEIAGLRLMVLRGNEVARKCGPGTAACYFPGIDTIVIVGEDRFGGLPTDYVLAHEYGHRVAQYSFNPPFRGGAFWHGPKHWASRTGVCEKLRRGVLSVAPTAYWNFPGENFAEAYAQHHIRGNVRWQYSPALKPGPAAFEAIKRDVETPWLRSRVRDLRVTLPPHGIATYRLGTPLDGRFTADLYGVRGSRFGFELRKQGRVISRARRPTADFRLSHLICGDRRLSLTVRAGALGGSYRLVIARP